MLIKMDKNAMMWIGAFLLVYFTIRILFSLNKKIIVIDKELNDIINSDKYKVKGQYD